MIWILVGLTTFLLFLLLFVTFFAGFASGYRDAKDEQRARLIAARTKAAKAEERLDTLTRDAFVAMVERAEERGDK